MTWTLTNLFIQIVAGVLGGHALAAAAHDYRFGFLGHTLTGLIGGFVSGCFLQTIVLTVVNADGGLNEPTAVETAVIQFFAGAAAGGTTVLAVALVKFIVQDSRSRKC